jgi:hypothetical protein
VAVAPEPEVEDTDTSALDDFDAHLQDYGTWVEDPKYGTVWVPHREAVGSRFAPYVTRGRWSLTPANEWLWVSDYPFGWVVFHYGRWVWTRDYGWSWIAGRQYSNAWVTFRVSDDPYIGWAPMPPRWGWRGGVAVSLGLIPPAAFVFAPLDYAFYPSVSSYVIYDRVRVTRLIGRSHYYTPAGRRFGHYYSPPIHRVPLAARPHGRMMPERRALDLRQPRRRLATGAVVSASVRQGSSARHALRPTSGASFRSQTAPTRGVVRRDSVNRDSVNRDSVNRDSGRRDSVNRRDAVNRDAVRRDSVRRDSVNPGSGGDRGMRAGARGQARPEAAPARRGREAAPSTAQRAAAPIQRNDRPVRAERPQQAPVRQERVVRPERAERRQAPPPRRETAPPPQQRERRQTAPPQRERRSDPPQRRESSPRREAPQRRESPQRSERGNRGGGGSRGGSHGGRP